MVANPTSHGGNVAVVFEDRYNPRLAGIIEEDGRRSRRASKTSQGDLDA
jgi:hypothetical protein